MREASRAVMRLQVLEDRAQSAQNQLTFPGGTLTLTSYCCCRDSLGSLADFQHFPVSQCHEGAQLF